MADFTIKEKGGNYDASFISGDNTSLSIKAKETDTWNDGSEFGNLAVELKAYNWKASLLEVENVKSSFLKMKIIFLKAP
ncbi:hypothetical protein [Pricia sp.]|uniref:hypothetical protein n=1 Tax=Pricia sp. TaxID=2268138 RepID=UPI003593A3C3